MCLCAVTRVQQKIIQTAKQGYKEMLTRLEHNFNLSILNVSQCSNYKYEQ